MNDKNIYRWDAIGCHKAGVHGHPQKVLQDMGYKVLRFEGVPIADCVFMETDRPIDPLPSYIHHQPTFTFIEDYL